VKSFTPIVRIGDVLLLQRRQVEVESGAFYAEIGVRSFGKGIFHKEPLLGADLGTKRIFSVVPGDLVVSNIFAWEGAVAVATDVDDGRVGSHRFMTWVPKREGLVDVRYVAHFLLSEQGLDLLRRASPGSAGRNKTLGIASFENLLIPLPGFQEQQRIANDIDQLTARTRDFGPDIARAVSAFNDLELRLINGTPSDQWVNFEDLVEVNPRRLPIAGKYHRVPMADVDEKEGIILGRTVLDPADTPPSGPQFIDGDVIFARITPSMQNGKSAVFKTALAAVGYGSTEFHVLRPKIDVSSEVVHALVRSNWFRDQARQTYTGTAGQQRVPPAFIRRVRVPDLRTPNTTVLAENLRRVDTQRRLLLSTLKKRAALRAALPDAARNQAFQTP